MASASASGEPPETECAVCHEDLTEPKILPCGHLLCQACLLSWFKAHTDPLCPICHCAILEPGDQRSREDVAGCLPTDLTMAALVTSTRTLRESHMCCVCDDVTASAICLDCGDTFCPSCTKVHQKQSATRHHSVEDLATLTAEKLTSSRRPSCVSHSHEPASLFCPTHGATVCVLCATSTHRACPEVQQLKDRMEEACAVLRELAARLQAGEEALEKGIEELDRHMADTEKQVDGFLADIDAACDRLQKSIEACRSRVKELVLKAKDDVRATVTAGRTVLQTRRGKLTSHRRLVERARHTAPSECIDKVKASLQARVTELDCSTFLAAGSPIINTFTLALDQSQLSRLETKLEELGELCVKPADVTVQQPLGFRFHDNHGQNIVLSNDGLTAQRVRGNDHGIVVSSQQMVNNILYEVRVDVNNPSSGNYLWVGMAVRHPAQLTFPSNADNWNDAIVICSNCVQVRGSGNDTSVTVGAKLSRMPVGTRAGVAVDVAGCLHLYIDGVDQGVAARNVPRPCYAFFDVYSSYRQVTALPATSIM